MTSILPLTVANVGYSAGAEQLIHDLTFELADRRCTIVLGPNGAGKSLTLRLCHGLLRPGSGTIRWGAPDATRRQAMVFQRPVLLRRSVRANVDYALALRKLPRAERRGRTARALERTGLLPLAGRSARALSGGEQQRLALARAWALEPEVLFLDEPTASLDPAATGAVERTVAAIREAGTKIVMTTHDLAQARRLADEVLFLHHGRLVERADAAAFFDGPESREATAFLKGELLW